jgi:hypothetical protein
MPSETYALIWRAVRERRQLTFMYEDRQRECCPMILGYAASGEEAVFVYQFAGESSGKLPNWRCLRVEKIQHLQSRSGPWHEGTSHKQAQMCVQFVDVDANIQETLTGDVPLPFGHPDLRPPRRSG